MTTYRVLYASALDHTSILGELPVSSFSFTETLNEAGSFNVTLPLDLSTTPKLTNAVARPSLTATDVDVGSHSILYFERDGVVLPFAGIPWTYSANVEANTLSFAGAGLLSYFDRLFIRSTLSYSGIDQHTIAKGLIDYAQAKAGSGSFVDTSGVTASGVTRDRTYYFWDSKRVGVALAELAAVRNGFDFSVSTSRVGGTITNALRLSYPATGRSTNFVFDGGANVQVLSLSGDGSEVVQATEGLGAGEGRDRLRRFATNTAGLSTRALTENVGSWPDVTVGDTLLDHAARLRDRGLQPVRQVTLRSFPDVVPTLGSYEVGDRIRVRASHGWLDIDDTFRVVSRTVQATEDGLEAVDVTLTGLEVFA